MKEREALRFGIIILAAGSSSRMGQSKQLLDINGEPLLRRTVQTALEVKPNDVIVVLGSNSEEHQEVIKDLPVKTIQNSNWQKGMGSSIKVGLKHLLEVSPLANAVMILVCDQPMLSGTHLEELKQAFKESGAPIIAMTYSGTLGIPAMFDKSFFSSLFNLPDDQGAKVVIQKNSFAVHSIPFPEGALDLDTLDDYLKFKTQHSNKKKNPS